MANGPERARFWRTFIAERCEYPAPIRLNAQLAVAEFFDFCGCGCNSFGVRVPASAEVSPLAEPNGNFGMIFEADFLLAGKSLEIALLLMNPETLPLLRLIIAQTAIRFPMRLIFRIRLFSFTRVLACWEIRVSGDRSLKLRCF
jgi:hypothetical protein